MTKRVSRKTVRVRTAPRNQDKIQNVRNPLPAADPGSDQNLAPAEPVAESITLPVSSPIEFSWYASGLNFSCTQCGNCCGGAPGFVWATAEEVRRIAEFLGRKDGWLGPEHVRREGFQYSLTEHADGDCVFLRRLDTGKIACTIYPVRPTQCRTWPFWKENLTDVRSWQWAIRRCPGCGGDKDGTRTGAQGTGNQLVSGKSPRGRSAHVAGKHYSVGEIQALMNAASPIEFGQPWVGEPAPSMCVPPPSVLLTKVENLYRELDLEIGAQAPVCVNRGQCCHFGKTGHRLYVTPVEVTYFRILLSGMKISPRSPVKGQDRCPYQVDGQCLVRSCRPLGCRIYFCDSVSQDWQNNLYERYHARLTELGRKYGLDYQYSDWMAVLGSLAP